MSVKIVALALGLLLTGCATSKEVYLADGSKGYSISCDGSMQNFGSCLEKAGELCAARGYEVVNQQGAAVPFSAATGGYSASSVAASGGIQAQSGMMVTRTLFVRCK